MVNLVYKKTIVNKIFELMSGLEAYIKTLSLAWLRTIHTF